MIGYTEMTRQEAARKVNDLLEKGYRIESEVICENRRTRLLSSHTGYKWLAVYTKNNKGVFTVSDVHLFDSRTEALRDNSTDGRLIAYKVY